MRFMLGLPLPSPFSDSLFQLEMTQFLYYCAFSFLLYPSLGLFPLLLEFPRPTLIPWKCVLPGLQIGGKLKTERPATLQEREDPKNIPAKPLRLCSAPSLLGLSSLHNSKSNWVLQFYCVPPPPQANIRKLILSVRVFESRGWGDNVRWPESSAALWDLGSLLPEWVSYKNASFLLFPCPLFALPLWSDAPQKVFTRCRPPWPRTSQVSELWEIHFCSLQINQSQVSYCSNTQWTKTLRKKRKSVMKWDLLPFALTLTSRYNCFLGTWKFNCQNKNRLSQCPPCLRNTTDIEVWKEMYLAFVCLDTEFLKPLELPE